MNTEHEMSTVNKLLMLQGINLIQDGIQFLEWMDDYKDINTVDALSILKDRFEYFKESALEDGSHDHLIIDKMKGLSKNIQSGHKTRVVIDERLNELRKIARMEYVTKIQSA
tara:strand:+ start:500 stop:835 length:336 start_codon:yes stop_codon:yes gene_type:complete